MERVQSTYQHGGHPAQDLVRLNLPHRPVIDFSVNINPLGVPDIIRERWMETLESIEAYPSVDGEGLDLFYREKFSIPRGCFLSGNGSTEMIYLAARVARLKSALILSPSYHDYERACLLAGTKAVRYPLSREENFAPGNVEQLVDALRQTEGLWLGRPNNPTGGLIRKQTILELAERFPEHWFIIDEAFIQFIDDWWEETLIRESGKPNILCIHSLTKFYAIPGLRLGGAAGDCKAISRLKQAKEPWTVNGIADSIAPLLLDCRAYEEKTRSVLLNEGKRMLDLLQGVEGVKPFPGSANFILCQWTRTRNLDDLLGYLLEKGAYVRDCRNFPGLEDNFFRIGLRIPAQNDQLISLLSSFH